MPTTSTTPAVPFATWTLKDAQAAVAAAVQAGEDEAGAFKVNQRFVEQHDHWQDGEGWIGPVGDASTRALVLAAVKRQFTPVDVIGEVLGRVASALLKLEADVTFTPRAPVAPATDPATDPAATEEARAAAAREAAAAEAAQRAEIEQVTTALASWWDRVHLWERAREAVRRSRWASRGALRLWVPASALVPAADGTAQLPRATDLAEALRYIALDAPAPDAAAVVTDPATQQRCAVFLYQVTPSGGGQPEDRAELWYVDPATQDTVARVLKPDAGGAAGAEEYRLSLGERIPMQEMAAQLLITGPVRQQQKRLNFFESMLVRVGEAAGFPERYLLNSAPNGVWSRQPPTDGTPALETREVDGVTYYLHAMPYTLGASVVTEVRGFEYEVDEQGKRSVTAPAVEFKEPTDPEFAIKSALHARATILESCHQVHALTLAEAQQSGYSKEQARADFEDDLATTRAGVEGMLRDTIEAALALAAAMGVGAMTGFLERYRAQVTLHVDPGPVSPDEQQVTTAQVAAGILSRRTAIVRARVEDVEAELTQIETEQETTVGPLVQRATAFKTFADAGLDAVTAARLAGLGAEQIAIIQKAEAEQPPATQGGEPGAGQNTGQGKGQPNSQGNGAGSAGGRGQVGQ